MDHSSLNAKKTKHEGTMTSCNSGVWEVNEVFFTPKNHELKVPSWLSSMCSCNIWPNRYEGKLLVSNIPFYQTNQVTNLFGKEKKNTFFFWQPLKIHKLNGDSRQPLAKSEADQGSVSQQVARESLKWWKKKKIIRFQAISALNTVLSM